MATDTLFETRVRVRFPFSNPGVVEPGKPASLVAVSGDDVRASPEVLPVKEWSIVDDVMTISDVVTFSVANDDGENTGRFPMGALVIIEESHSQVVAGAWMPHFTGRVTATESYDDIQGGSNILVTCMDLGWHLINCHAPAHISIRGARFAKRSPDKAGRNKRTLLEILIDPTWGFDLTEIKFDGDEMSRLRHGRQVIKQAITQSEGQILPYIQVETGQSPYEIMKMYAEREGLLVNVDVYGQLVFFRPNYKKAPIFELFHYPSKDPNSRKNNVVGRPSVRETIDGLYSKVTCWSTTVHDDQALSDNPNAAYRRTSFTPGINPLPFNRHHVITDSEAINPKLRENRGRMRYQLGLFESWEYSAEFAGHVQGPEENKGFFTSNELITVRDPINGADGLYYISMVQRSSTLSGGDKTRVVIKKAGLLDPTLGSLTTKKEKAKSGGGVKTPLVKETPPASQDVVFDPNKFGWGKK